MNGVKCRTFSAHGQQTHWRNRKRTRNEAASENNVCKVRQVLLKIYYDMNVEIISPTPPPSSVHKIRGDAPSCVCDDG